MTKYEISEKTVVSKAGKEITFIVINVSVGGELMEIGSILKTESIDKIIALQEKFGA